MKKILISFILLFGIEMAQAQIHEIGVGLGGVNYVGDIGSTQYIAPKNLGYNVFYRWNRSPRHSYKISYSHMKITGDDAKSSMESRKARGLKFNNTIQELTLGLEFNFFEFDLHEEQFAMTPYLFTGISGIRYNDLYFRGHRMVKGGKKYSAAIPIAAGLKFRLTPQLILNAEVAANYSFTDNLDGSHSSDSNLEKFNFGKNGNDWYFYSGISLSFTFGQNPCYCE
ncbi:type IX secretion system protein PorG [Myroides indicus]|uniref:DUF6089 domain-containing protein n=1 Tax=Myroides indicus TaxID=1323422 RepID=A0A4R7F6W7_9FLAO|nr:DUF6089 family protein [Myroides indicus]TDS61479.1 hypothetical protein C8P70_10820 [Myroides indicus]